jgi:hypothetical protein
MKLYTEEQMKSFYELGKIDGIIGIKKDVNEEIKEYTPIELPSVEEIWDEGDKEDNNGKRYAFMRGAKWMRDKIQGGNNEQR